MTAVEQVTELLDTPLRVTLVDGRVLIGQFSCFDKQRNVLLNEVREYRPAEDGRLGASRLIGIVLVPRRWISACHAPDVS